MATATQVRRVLLQVQTDDGDSEARIAAISAKADELSNKHPELKVRIDTAAASAKVKVLRDELRGVAVAAEAEPIKPVVEDDPAKAKIGELQRQLARMRLEKQGITVSVDASEAEIKIAELKAKIDALGNEAGGEVATAVDRGFRLRIRPRVAGWTSLIVGGMAGLPAAAAATGALMASALGAKLLIGTKAVQGPLYAQWTQLSHTLMSVMRVAALPLLQPLRDAFAQIGTWAKQMEPLISRAFGAVGPLIGPLVRGLEGLVSGVLPGFITLMHAAAPAVSMVASLLGSLSKAAGGMLSGLAPAVRASSSVLGSLGQVVRAIAPVAALLAGSLATGLAPALRSVAQVVTILAPVLSRVGGLLVQLAGSALQVVARTLAAVLPPAARMVEIMANGLAPVLPALTQAITLAASAISGPMLRSLAQVMPSMEQLVRDTLALYETAIVPLLPQIGQLAGDLMVLGTQALLPLLPPVLKLADYLTQLATQVIIPLMPQIQKLTGYLVTMADAAVKAMSLVSRALSLFGVSASATSSAGLGGYGGGIAESALGGGNLGEGGYSAGVAAGSAYGAAWADGATTAAKKAAAARAAAHKLTPADFALILAGGAGADLTGTAAQVRAGVGKLISAITQDEKAGVLSQSQGSALTLWLDKDSARLQTLASKRVSVMREIAAAQKYAASVATNIRQADSLTAAAAGGWNGGPQTTGQIISNLRLDVASIQKFAANIRKLQKLGLNRTYLAQLIQMGPDQGGQLAEQLASSGLSDIRQINAAESQIVQVSGYLGKTAANAMYDSGAMAGKGFLSGLEAQQAAITKMMEKIAKSMVDTLKRELGIHSPSTVTRDLARMTGAGIPLGLEDSLGPVRTSASRLARAMVPRPGAGGGGYGAGPGGGLLVTFDFKGVPPAVRTWLKKSIRVNGGDPAVMGA